MPAKIRVIKKGGLDEGKHELELKLMLRVPAKSGEPRRKIRKDLDEVLSYNHWNLCRGLDGYTKRTLQYMHFRWNSDIVF